MTLRIAGMAAALLTAASAASVAAQTAPQLIETVGDWNLYYSETLGGSCFIERTDAEGRQFQIGADRERNEAYIGILARAGSDVTEDMMKNVKFDLGGQMYEGEARRFNFPDSDVQGGYVYFNNLDFATDLANQEVLKVMPEDAPEFSLSLAGSKAAMEKALECQVATTQ